MAETKPRRLTRRALLRGGLAAAGGGIAVGLIDSRLRVSRHTLHLPRWDAGGFRLVHLSDFHVNDDAKLATARAAVRLALAERPDLIVFTGDFLNFAREECLANIPKAFAELSDARCPCLAIMGNHDYHCGAPGKVAEAVRKTRLRMLVNEAAEVDGVRVVGLDDALFGAPDGGLVDAKDARSTITLLHEPDATDDIRPRSSLVLSGHSHGGEVCLPGGRPLYTPFGSKRYVAGFYPNAPSPLFVSRGVATLGPGRVFCPPEVCVLELR